MFSKLCLGLVKMITSAPLEGWRLVWFQMLMLDVLVCIVILFTLYEDFISLVTPETADGKTVHV